MKPVITFENVKKEFSARRGGALDIKHYLIRPFYRRKFAVHLEQKVVLNGVSFKINSGEFVGIMGRNGVGKSTLLKLISKIYEPNEGDIVTTGTVATVLELGAGFATELSGLENIFLNASILGFSRKQILNRVEQIIEFSELKNDIFEPVRNYSSGMLVRLAFSITCHLDSEILLFDEVLAVGDLGFQRKCISKIMEQHRLGRTVVLVTHSPEQVAAHCDRCLVLDGGKLIFDGNAKEGTLAYSRLFAQPSGELPV